MTEETGFAEPELPLDLGLDVAEGPGCPSVAVVAGDRYPCTLSRGHEGSHEYCEAAPWDDEPVTPVVHWDVTRIGLISALWDSGVLPADTDLAEAGAAADQILARLPQRDGEAS
jgi:hypothetical protein